MYRLSVALVGLFRIAESICTYAHQSDGRTFGYHAVLSSCSTSVAQVFGYNESGNYSRSFLSQMAAPSYVALEVCGSSYVSGTEIGTWEYTSLLNQKWTLLNPFGIASDGSGGTLCLSTPPGNGSALVLAPCASTFAQNFTFDSAVGRISHAQSGLCVDTLVSNTPSKSPTTSSQSASVSASASGSLTSSSSPASSPTASLTLTTSGSRSRSTTYTPSQSATCAASTTLSSTQSLSTPSTSTQPALHVSSWSPTLTSSTSISQRRTLTSSQIPREPTLSLVPLGNAAVFATTIELSDSIPTQVFEATMSSCPNLARGTSAVLSILCSIPPTIGTSIAVVAPTSASDARCTPPPIESATVNLGVDVGIRAVFGCSTATGLLVCSARQGSNGPFVSNATLTWNARPTLWPLWSDAIIVSAFGTMRSVTFGLVNATSSLLAAACELSYTRCNDSLADALADADVILAAAAMSFPLAPSSRHSAVFTLTLTGKSQVLLHANQRSFSASMTVTLGIVPCSILGVSSDGTWVLLSTPASGDLCVGSSNCGYQRLTVQTRSSFAERRLTPSADARRLVDSTVSTRYRGAALVCPPFCAGSGLPASAFPYPFDSNSFAPALVSSSGAVLRLPDVPAASSEGVYYARACNSTGLYTDLTSGACAVESNPEALLCAYGSGDGCSLCPHGALCPGGDRMWTRTGYWAPSESVTSVLPCPFPSSRCSGWDAVAGATQCSIGYRPLSYLCWSCDDDYFLADDGSCIPCPVDPSTLEQYAGIVELTLGVLACAIVIFLFLVLLVRCVGGTIVRSARRMAALAVWTLTSVQVVSLVAAVTSPQLPASLQYLFQKVVLLQLDDLVFSPVCTGAYLFSKEVGVMIAALTVWVLTLVFYSIHATLPRCLACARAQRKQASVWIAIATRILITFTIIMYPAACIVSLRMLSCSPVQLTRASLLALDGGSSYIGNMSPTRSVDTTTVQLLNSNPFYICWKGSHQPIGIFAACVVGFYVFAFPVVAFLWLGHHFWRQASENTTQTVSQRNPSVNASVKMKPHRETINGRRSSITRKGSVDDEDTMSMDKNSEATGVPQSGPRRTRKSGAVRDRFLMAAFIADFRKPFWFTKLLDLLLLLFLAALRTQLPFPSSLHAILGKALAIIIVTLSLAVFVLLYRPFRLKDEWKGWTRSLLLVVCAGSAALTASVEAINNGWAGDSVRGTLTIGSYLLLSTWVLTVCVLIGGVWWFMWNATRRDVVALEARQRRRSLNQGVNRGSLRDSTSAPTAVVATRKDIRSNNLAVALPPAEDATWALVSAPASLSIRALLEQSNVRRHKEHSELSLSASPSSTPAPAHPEDEIVAVIPTHRSNGQNSFRGRTVSRDATKAKADRPQRSTPYNHSSVDRRIVKHSDSPRDRTERLVLPLSDRMGDDSFRTAMVHPPGLNYAEPQMSHSPGRHLPAISAARQSWRRSSAGVSAQNACASGSPDGESVIPRRSGSSLNEGNRTSNHIGPESSSTFPVIESRQTQAGSPPPAPARKVGWQVAEAAEVVYEL